jgi:hypothetical protein
VPVGLVLDTPFFQRQGHSRCHDPLPTQSPSVDPGVSTCAVSDRAAGHRRAARCVADRRHRASPVPITQYRSPSTDHPVPITQYRSPSTDHIRSLAVSRAELNLFLVSRSPGERRCRQPCRVGIAHTDTDDAIGLPTTPTRSISTSTTSPGPRYRGGVRLKPTPPAFPCRSCHQGSG